MFKGDDSELFDNSDEKGTVSGWGIYRKKEPCKKGNSQFYP